MYVIDLIHLYNYNRQSSIYLKKQEVDREIEVMEALQKLSFAGIKCRFVTNTTNESLSSLQSRLSSMGFNIQKKDIFTFLSAASALVKKNNLRPMLFLEEKSAISGGKCFSLL